MYKTKLFNRKAIVTLLTCLFFTSCGPEFNELLLPPIEDYKIGIPILDGPIAFSDLLSDEDVDQLKTDPSTGGLYFEFYDSIAIANTDDIVQAFGSSSSDDFFSISFPNPIPSDVPSISLPNSFSVGLVMGASGACDVADACVPLGNDVGGVGISYLRFIRGGIQANYRANLGDQITITLDNIQRGTETSISVTQVATFTGNQPSATLDITNVEFDLNVTPIISVEITDTDGNPSGNITGIQLTPTNSADRVKLKFNEELSAEVDIPTGQINTDYLSDVFPEDAEIRFKSPLLKFSFTNPIGADISVNLGRDLTNSKNGIIGVNAEGTTVPIQFSSDSATSISGDNSLCSQLIAVNGATSFDTVATTKVFACNTEDLLNIRPTQIAYDGKAEYLIEQGDEVLFTAGSELKAYFLVQVPLYIGFSGMNYTSGSDLDLNFTSEIDKVKGVLRSEVINGLPIGGKLKLTTKTSESGTVTSEIDVKSENGDELIKAASTDADGGNVTESTNYIEVSLLEEQVRAILNAGYIEMSFELEADADSTTDVPEPVQILDSQSMNFKMALFLQGSVQLDTNN